MPKQAGIWWREAHLFPSGGDALDASHSDGARSHATFTLDPVLPVRVTPLLSLPSGVCACGKVLAFCSALSPPVHRKATRIHANLSQVSLQCPSAHLTWGYTSTRGQKKMYFTLGLI